MNVVVNDHGCYGGVLEQKPAEIDTVHLDSNTKGDEEDAEIAVQLLLEIRPLSEGKRKSTEVPP